MTVTLHPARKAGRLLTLLSLAGLCAAALPAQAGITTLDSFTGYGPGTNGDSPQSGVTFDNYGNLFGTTEYGGASGYGTVYEIAKGNSTITDLPSFIGTNGSSPFAGVTFDSSGNLFGTTNVGGAHGAGTVYEIDKLTGTIKDLDSFTGKGVGTNGGAPIGGVTFDSSGNLFGTTQQGGAHGFGTVYEIATGTTTIKDLDSFTGNGVGTNGSYPHSGVTFDKSGNLFGTTNQGGAHGFGTVYEIAKGTTTIKDLDSFNGTNGNIPESSVTFDSSGNLFGTTYQGGISGFGTVYEIVKGTTTIKDLASFTGNGVGTNGGNPYGAVTFDSSGNLFGTATQGGTFGAGTVYEIAKGTSTIKDLDSFTGTGAGTNGGNPYGGVTFDSSGNLFGTTGNGGTHGSGTVYEIAGAGSPVPESSTVISFATLLGLGGLLLRARKHRQNATPGV